MTDHAIAAKLALWKIAWITGILVSSAVTGASGVTTAVVATEVFHWDMVIAGVATAVITGAFGTIQVIMLSRLHRMVNSQQSELNRLSQIAEKDAAYRQGIIDATLTERTKHDLEKKADEPKKENVP